jgi:hypothetical protein
MNRITILFILLLFSLFLFYKPKKIKHRNNCICIRDNFKIIDSTYLSPSQEFLKIVPKILYINLENRKDRNKEFLSNFPDYDPNTNTIERIDAIYDSQNGNIGCLKSHIKALKHAMTLDTPYILFTEDDFYIKDMNYAVNSLKKVFKNFQKGY